ncbi:hypothetical protein HDU82_003674, partial [Entophlyctis luteolus]
MDLLALAVSLSQPSPVPSAVPTLHSALPHVLKAESPLSAAACKISIANLVNTCNSDAPSAITSPSPEPSLFSGAHLASPANSLRSSMSLSPTAAMSDHKGSDIYNDKGQRLR